MDEQIDISNVSLNNTLLEIFKKAKERNLIVYEI
jgi:hypothetical protein